MQPIDLFTTIVRQAGDSIAHISTEQLDNPTPCSEWNLRALLNHMVYELLWAPDMLAGKTVAQVGGKYDGDVLGDDFHEAWQQAATGALEAAAKAEPAATVHLSYADKPAGLYITELASDILVHAWDAAQAVGCSLRTEEPVARAVYEYIAPRIQDYRKAGAVAAAVPVPDDAPLIHKLVALMGRQPATP